MRMYERQVVGKGLGGRAHHRSDRFCAFCESEVSQEGVFKRVRCGSRAEGCDVSLSGVAGGRWWRGGGGGGRGQAVGVRKVPHGVERGEWDQMGQLTVPVLLVVAGHQRASAGRPR